MKGFSVMGQVFQATKQHLNHFVPKIRVLLYYIVSGCQFKHVLSMV